MTSHIATLEAAKIYADSNRVLGESIDVAAECRTSPVSIVDEPQFNTIYDAIVTSAISHSDGDPWLLNGYIWIGGKNTAGTIHVSALAGETKTLRDSRFGLFKAGDEIAVELLEKTSNGYRFSERLAAGRRELNYLMERPTLHAVLLDDANEDTESVFVIVNEKHKARLHASDLKDSTRELRDARMKSFKKGDTLEVKIKSFVRHPKFPAFQVSCQEVGKQERKPVSSRKPARVRTKSPLGNKTGDRAAAEAKRNDRRLRDQALRNKMKTAGGKKN